MHFIIHANHLHTYINTYADYIKMKDDMYTMRSTQPFKKKKKILACDQAPTIVGVKMESISLLVRLIL